jgi:hypothetical protein
MVALGFALDFFMSGRSRNPEKSLKKVGFSGRVGGAPRRKWSLLDPWSGSIWYSDGHDVVLGGYRGVGASGTQITET